MFLRPSALLLLLVLTACAQVTAREVPPQPRGAETAGEADNPLATLTVATAQTPEGRPAVELLVTGLRPDERAVDLRLLGPDGQQIVANPDDIRHGNRLAGSSRTPRVGLTGSSSRGVGVTLSLDLFGRRPELPPESPNALRAWTRLALPDAADPADWTASAIIEDGYGHRQRLAASDG